MTAAAAGCEWTLQDAKNAVMPLLAEIAARLRRRVVTCPEPSVLCDHTVELALADLYDQCAGRVQAAEDHHQVHAAVLTAVEAGV